MSLQVILWATEQRDLSPTQKLTLLALADFANDRDFTAYPSQKALADWTGLSTRAVRLATKRLEKLGLVMSVRRQRDSNCFFLPGDRIRAYLELDFLRQAEPVGGVQ